MSILAWIVLGLIAGFIGSKLVNKTGEGVILDIVLGVVGALVGGYLFSIFGTHGVTGLNLYSLFVAGDRRGGRPACLSRGSGTGKSITLVTDTCKRAAVRPLIRPSATRGHEPEQLATVTA